MNTVADKIIAREFVITSELTPPKGIDLTEMFAKAELLRGSVDAFNLTESPRARMAIAPVARCHARVIASSAWCATATPSLQPIASASACAAR